MTSENRTLLELSDILGIEFQCPRCEARVLYPFTKSIDRMIDRCPNCLEPWFTENPHLPAQRGPVAEEVRLVVLALRDLIERKDVIARVKLHVAEGLPR